MPRSSAFARLLLAFTGFLALLAACASPPDFDEIASTTPDATPRLHGARGPLSARQSRAILERLQRENPGSDVLQRHLAFEEAISDTPLTVGNKVTVLRDGDASFAAIFKAVGDAKTYISLEYFTFEDVEENGQHIVDLLIARQQAGVQVNLIYDSFGSSGTPSDVFARLREGGIKVLEFHPLSPTAAYSVNDRDHRKILVADGTTGIVGGVNLSKVYSSNVLSSPDKETPPEHWRDTDLEIEGPAVADLQRLFLDTWAREKGGELNQANFFPAEQPHDGQVVRIIGSSPDRRRPLFYITLLSAISTAESRIWLTAAYFVPTHQEAEDLAAAARRGVDVRLLLPSHSDSSLALDAGRAHYADMLEAGVKIYERRNAILHSKTATIDGVWSAVGSSNFDGRSVLFNNEVDAIVLGRETAAQLEAGFQSDIKESDEITLAAWEHRPFGEKLREMLSKMWSYWL